MSRYKIIEYQKDFLTGELKRVGELGGVHEGGAKQRVCVVPATPNDAQLPKALEYWRARGYIVSAERIRNRVVPAWEPPKRTLAASQQKIGSWGGGRGIKCLSPI